MSNNGDTHREFRVGKQLVRGLGSFHKTLPHDHNGEVCKEAFEKLVAATEGDGTGFAGVPKGTGDAAALTNPQGGLAADRLTHHPAAYMMPPAPPVLSETTAAEMTELYWMALLRDLPFNEFGENADVRTAAGEIKEAFTKAAHRSDPCKLLMGVDVPGSAAAIGDISTTNLFRLGLPGEEVGPMVSQFFVRKVAFGTQTIDQKQLPYRKGLDFLTKFPDWLHAQRSGRDSNGQAYPSSNEHDCSFFDAEPRYISTMRDLARFVNKDALHQAYFNAALVMLSGGAKWTPGNPYSDCGPLNAREAGFGVLGGPHILALVSEVATRALKVVWNQKWQTHLRLRPEAYGGLVHVEHIGGERGEKRPYKLPFNIDGHAAKMIRKRYDGYLLPMAFTPGSPTHPAYGAGHATVAGACVTVLKAYFETIDKDTGAPIPFVFSEDANPKGLKERSVPHGKGAPIKVYQTGRTQQGKVEKWDPVEIDPSTGIPAQLTIEGELNKLAQNVAMGRSMGGVHWRTDNSRSLVLGEAIAAEILAEITTDLNEHAGFEFRTFARDAKGNPKQVRIRQGRIFVNGKMVDTHGSAL
jgi:hypothetical protein